MGKLGKFGAVLVAGVGALTIVDTAKAHWPSGLATVEIVDRSAGRVLPIYVHEGRRYVVGRPGNEYAIRVRNDSSGRLLAVMSVDGVNVITGDTASPAQSGYVLAPQESTDIAGWRKSMSHTAAFYFTALPDSYAARTGRADNVGVIGVAVFRERPSPMAFEGPRRQDAARGEAKAERSVGRIAADAASPAPAPSLGTGHGRSESLYTRYTQFERASDVPAETITVYYDSYENLLAQGVPIGVPPLARLRPEPFPDRGRFVPDPR